MRTPESTGLRVKFSFMIAMLAQVPGEREQVKPEKVSGFYHDEKSETTVSLSLMGCSPHCDWRQPQ
jgi:hypothetical protein